MIDINLIPGDKRRKKSRAGLLPAGFVLPREVVIGLVGGFLVVLALWHILLQVIIVTKYVQLKGLQQRWEKVLPEKNKVDATLVNLRQLQERVKTIGHLKGDQAISWAQKFQSISANLPRGVWLKHLLVENQMLTIKGSSVSKHRVEMINVHTFVKKLKDDASFMKGVQAVELESIKNREVGQITVADFMIRVMLEKEEDDKNVQKK